MLKYIITPAVTAFATQSSAATLPVNKEACDSIGVPKDVSDLVLPMGCTMHMDGSVLSSIVKITFLFGVFHMPFTGVGTYAMAIAVAILSAFVLSGAPGGGLVGEMLIVSMFGFPAEAFPLIATLGFLFDPPATCLNASGDTIASMMVSRLVEGKDWLSKKMAAVDAAGQPPVCAKEAEGTEVPVLSASAVCIVLLPFVYLVHKSASVISCGM